VTAAKRGRPPLLSTGERLSTLYVRMPPADLAVVKRASKLLGQSAAEYAREAVVERARADLGELRVGAEPVERADE
jgi:hypothetical protein